MNGEPPLLEYAQQHVVKLRVVADRAMELGHDRLIFEQQLLDLDLFLTELVLVTKWLAGGHWVVIIGW